MSTKNIARTVIEGGRAGFNKEARRYSNTKFRAATRKLLEEAESLEDPEDLDTYPNRRPVMKEFADKIRPTRRWMEKQVGRKWDEVYSELRKRFDTRTTAGRHILFDHLLQEVTDNPADPLYKYHRFLIDENGVLQKGELLLRGRLSWKHITTKDVWEWAKDRKVADYGVSIFWMVPEGGAVWKQCTLRWSCHNYHRDGIKRVRVAPSSVLGYEKNLLPQERDSEGNVTYYRESRIVECSQPIGKFHQSERFSDKDIEFWNRLGKSDKKALLHISATDQKMHRR